MLNRRRFHLTATPPPRLLLLHFFSKYDFHNFVFSMKASNPLVMVQAYRLLAAEQYR